MKTNELAAQLGISANAVLNHKNRKPDLILEGTHYNNTGGGLDWTDEGVALLMTMVSKNNPADNITTHSSMSLPNPDELGQRLGGLVYTKHVDGYSEAVNTAAQQEYDRLMSDYLPDLGKSLATTWGLAQDVVMGLLEATP
jgi:hypothetical protein